MNLPARFSIFAALAVAVPVLGAQAPKARIGLVRDPLLAAALADILAWFPGRDTTGSS